MGFGSILGQTADLSSITSGMTKIVTGSYVGTGSSGESDPLYQNQLTFDGTPYLVIITCSDNSLILLLVYNGKYGALFNALQDNIYVTWQGRTVKWYSGHGAGYQMNDNGKTYSYIAFIK